MYCLEVYTTDFETHNKRAFKVMPDLLAFDYLMKGVIKNAIPQTDLYSADNMQAKVVCKLVNYTRFKLHRSRDTYVLMVLVPEANLRFFSNQRKSLRSNRAQMMLIKK
jgi:hypothetical protein